MFDMFPRGMSLVLVLEYMCYGLWEMLHHNQAELTLPRVKTYAQMLLKGTRYMHAHYVMHRVRFCLKCFFLSSILKKFIFI